NSGIGLNTILYGPPGTGKTYHSAYYAVAICDNIPIEEALDLDDSYIRERYNQLKEDDRIAFTTFHQSYGYEEFIEGIRPVTKDVPEDDSESKTLGFQKESGVFKEFCDTARNSYVSEENEDWGLNDNPTVWKVSLEGTGDNPTRTDCMENNRIRIGWGEYGPDITRETTYAHGGRVVLNSFYNRMKKGDIVISCYSAEVTDAIGVVVGDAEWDDSLSSFNRVRKVKWLVKGIRENIVKINENKPMVLASVYRMDVSSEDALNIVKKYVSGTKKTTEKKNYVFIIDEINRGNISKVFGELITLIEDSKREGASEEIRLRLPYSKQLFGVPDNVYILGTMNTADRSIALMDTALRRRFQFVEMMPDSEVLKGIIVEQDGETIDIAEMIKIINLRIEYLYDREHTIGHAYFMPLVENPSIDKLAEIFDTNIIPLLKEYFYEDYGKIQMILGDNKKSSDNLKFVKETKLITKDIFNGDTLELDLPEQIYSIQKDALYNIRSYKEISKDL
nr:AAA family ATPase [Lachnospiraceae bacterium]